MICYIKGLYKKVYENDKEKIHPLQLSVLWIRSNHRKS